MDAPEYTVPHKPSECPACRSSNIIKVLTGSDWHDTDEDEELCRIGKAVKYAGDCFIDDMPKWKCLSCDHYIYKDPPKKKYIFDSKPQRCPVCDSPRIMSVIYGEPCFDDELRRKVKNGEWLIGGCEIWEHFPAWVCRDCLQDLHTSRRYPG